MLKETYKRVVAGILAVMMSVTIVSLSVFADDVTETNSGMTSKTADEIQEYMEVLQYLETLGSEYSLPAIMISEGDSVYDAEDYLIASTTVPITKNLVNDQTKVKTQYWLDSMRVGDAAALNASEIALVNYHYSYNGK